MRYGDEAYPRLSALKERDRSALKVAQSALGDWHDRLQWLAQAERHMDLQELIPTWRQALVAAEVQGDEACTALVALFPAKR